MPSMMRNWPPAAHRFQSYCTNHLSTHLDSVKIHCSRRETLCPGENHLCEFLISTNLKHTIRLEKDHQTANTLQTESAKFSYSGCMNHDKLVYISSIHLFIKTWNSIELHQMTNLRANYLVAKLEPSIIWSQKVVSEEPTKTNASKAMMDSKTTWCNLLQGINMSFTQD